MALKTAVPFGKYELISKIAAGGMAEIYLARNQAIPGFEKTLVIKKIRRNLTSDPDFVRMFLNEARIAATLAHPNIVQIYDVGQIHGEYFIAMEYLQGHNLIEVVRAGAKLGYSKPPLEHVLSVLSAVCAGLHYAHDQRDFEGRPLELVHRDVTPQNIVITFDGAIKLVDFGIAKIATHHEFDAQSGTLKGKIGYMSPEQCRGQEVDRRSDLFAIGVMLYELTTGKRLYYERTDFETLKKIVDGPVPSPRDLLPFYPAGLNSIIMRCLQKDAKDRYSSARELHADLEAFAHDQQLQLGTVALAEYMQMLFMEELEAKQRRMPSQSGMLFATQMAVGNSTSSSYQGEARRSSQTDIPLFSLRRRHRTVRAMQALGALLLVGATGAFLMFRSMDQSASQKIVAGIEQTAQKLAASTANVAAAGQKLIPVGEAQPAAIADPNQAKLNLSTEPSCEVLLDGQPVGVTPLRNFPIAPGSHSLLLLNSTVGIRETKTVDLHAGETWTRNWSWETAKPVVEKSDADRAREFANRKEIAPLPTVPHSYLRSHRHAKLNGTYEICIDGAGNVTQVTPKQSIVGLDSMVVDALRRWQFKPDAEQVDPLCVEEEVIVGAGGGR